MGGKKKGAGKKKDKDAAPPPVEEPSEFDKMDIETLKEHVADLRNKLEVAQLERNQVQLDRDTIQTFYDITKKEVRDYELATMAKDREMEIMEDNHRVEVRVYMQKVKHLEYEHKNMLGRVEALGNTVLFEEKEAHEAREEDLRKKKRAMKLELRETELLHAREVEQLKQTHDKNLQKLRTELNKQLQLLNEKWQGRVGKLRRDLELRRKVEIHEIEERKNLHINDLLRNHEEAFGEIKKYYNDITRDNLKMIKDLKTEVAEMTKKAATTRKLMEEIAEENNQLSEPLKVAVAEVEALKTDLRDADKDRLSLKNAKARLRVQHQTVDQLRRDHATLEADFEALETEKRELYDRFEATLNAVARKAEFKNMVLERRLDGVMDQCNERQEQLRQVLTAANLDPAVLGMVNSKVDDVLSTRNTRIKDLQFNIARVSKAHNDILRVYRSRMTELGVPVDEEEFRELPALNTTVGPAGLVAKPTT